MRWRQSRAKAKTLPRKPQDKDAEGKPIRWAAPAVGDKKPKGMCKEQIETGTCTHKQRTGEPCPDHHLEQWGGRQGYNKECARLNGKDNLGNPNSQL